MLMAILIGLAFHFLSDDPRGQVGACRRLARRHLRAATALLCWIIVAGAPAACERQFQKIFRGPSGLRDRTSGSIGKGMGQARLRSLGKNRQHRRSEMSRTTANLLLLIAAALWGIGNIAQKTVLEHLDPFSAVGLRCLVGGLLILPLLRLDGARTAAAGFWKSAARVAGIFALALVAQQMAFLSTSVTNAGFLVNTCAVLTPILAWVVLRERASLRVWGAAAATMVGIFMLCGGLRGIGDGEIVALLSALLYAAWMVDLGRHMQRFGHPVRTACMQFLVTAAVALPIGGLAGSLSAGAAFAAGPELLLLGVGSTALAFGFQTIAQRYTPASHAAVIVSAKGVFGALAAACILGERLPITGVLGAMLMLAAILHIAFGRAAERQARTGFGPG
jgi:drug/metabolite transporter (DMT)-like permease